MGITLSLIGTYREALMIYAKDPTIACVLDDTYARGIPHDTDILLTCKTLMGRIVQGIVRVDHLRRLGDMGKISAYYEFKVYGVDNLFGAVIPSRKLPVIKTVQCVDIIEYKILDVSEAPLFINWYWLATSLRRKLFQT